MIRRLVPALTVALALVATALASAPWLRSYPSSVLAVPLFGAAALSVALPLVLVRIGVVRLWATILADAAAFFLYALLVVVRSLHSDQVVDGVIHGPSQILSYALPLVSPRSLLVAPVLLCWLSGALAGECLARRWSTVLPYAGWLVAFGLSYAATVRAISDEHAGRVYDTVLAGLVLLVLLGLRATQVWRRQDESAESTQADGVLPVRGLLVGGLATVLVAVAAAGISQAGAFTSAATTPQRFPAVDQTQPLSPVSFVAGLRPSDPRDPGTGLFTVQLDHPAPAYFAIANVDYYDGAGWTFDRTFRPSGGVVPADTDASLDTTGTPVTQQYSITSTALTGTPWMPYLPRAERVTGVSINVDQSSGMIVPSSALPAGSGYTVRSEVPTAGFGTLGTTALPAPSAPGIDTQLPPAVVSALPQLVQAFAADTGVSPSNPIAFLQAVLKDLQTNYAQAGAAASPSGSPTPSPTPSPSSSPSAPGRGTASTPSPSAAASDAQTAGGTQFGAVLAAILTERVASPEQYATLFALLARQLHVPARVVSGFRVAGAGATVPAGRYTLTTAEAWTWVEIPIRGVGWVDLDPTPGRYVAPAQPTQAASPAPSSTAPPTQNPLITQSAGGHAVAPRSSTKNGRHGGGVPWWPLVLILILLVLIAVLLVLLMRKQARRRRRRSVEDPRERIVNAWHEGLDRLAESGLPPLDTLTGAEVAALTLDQFGPEPAAHAAFLGAASNAVIYSTSTLIVGADGDDAWSAERDLTRLVRGQLSWWARLRAVLRFHRH